MVEAVIGSCVALGLGAVVLWWGRACQSGKLPQNWILGYRTKLTLTNEQAWVAVHKAAAPWILLAGTGVVIAGLTGVVLALINELTAARVALGLSAPWVLLWVLVGFTVSSRAAKTYKK